MKKIPVVFPILFLVVLMSASCGKKESVAPTTYKAFIPWNMDSMMPTTALYINNVFLPNVHGALTANRLTADLVDTMGYHYAYGRSWEHANFVNPGFMIDAGMVQVNGTTLTNGSAGYLHNDDGMVWNATGSNTWSVGGSGLIPAFSASVAGRVPSFTGTLPLTLSPAGYSYTFDASNTSNGDSAYIIVYCPGTIFQSKVVSANGGTATLDSFHAPIPGGSLNRNFYVWSNAGGNPVYYGGMILFVIFNHSEQTLGGKQFGFVQQREVLGVVRFL